jgi:Rrf2 family transcriptional regulator, nitric oxide-sensitive transcriptional repressor
MMTISQTAEYALRAVVWLAAHPDAALSTPAIARATQVPAGYLSKVLQELARAGFVVSQAGRSGGFRLTRPPEQVSVLDIINAVAPIERIRRCPLGLASHSGQLCPLHRRLDAAVGLMERAFAESTIAELLSEPNTSPPLCERDRTG